MVAWRDSSGALMMSSVNRSENASAAASVGWMSGNPPTLARRLTDLFLVHSDASTGNLNFLQWADSQWIDSTEFNLPTDPRYVSSDLVALAYHEREPGISATGGFWQIVYQASWNPNDGKNPDILRKIWFDGRNDYWGYFANDNSKPHGIDALGLAGDFHVQAAWVHPPNSAHASNWLRVLPYSEGIVSEELRDNDDWSTMNSGICRCLKRAGSRPCGPPGAVQTPLPPEEEVTCVFESN